MIKKLSLFSTLTFASLYLSAKSIDESSSENSMVIWLILGVAVCALLLAIVNYFRISYNSKVAEVEMVNQKDDLNVTIEAVKVALSKEIRYLRKEVGKSQRGLKPNHNQPVTQTKSENEDEVDESNPLDKKPFKKKSSNFKRRPPHKRPIDKSIEPEE